MAKKWYNYFLSVDEQAARETQAAEAAEGQDAGEAPATGSPRTAAQTVADIASGLNVQPRFTAPVANPSSFDQIYTAAEITAPTHGFTILKIIDLLQSEHIRNLSRDVRRSSLMLALEAAGVKPQDVVQDAVLRDKALDTFESVQQKALTDLEAKRTQENKELQAEIDRRITEMQSKIQANNDEVAKEKERFYGWQLKKQQEEQKIGDAVSYLTTEKPATAAPTPAGAKAAEKRQ